MKNIITSACALCLSFFIQSFCHSQAPELFPSFYPLDIDGNALRAAYVSNHPLDKANDKIDRVIMMVHGANRNQISYKRVVAAAEEQGVADKTLIFMPQFLISKDIDPLNVPADVLYWGGGWREGDLSSSSFPARIGSFELGNRIITSFVSLNPSVSKVVITGHSAGGQYAQRFAAGSMLEQSLAPMGISVRYVSSNPSTFVYFNSRRYVPDTNYQFAPLTSNQISDCPKYNEYKYGLDDLNSFMSGVGKDQILSQYQSRDVRYVQGEDDTESGQLDLDCEAKLQGNQRIQRGIIFYMHLRDAFGGDIHKRHQQVIVPDLGHSSRTLTSSCGLNFLFDIGACDIATPGNLTAKRVDNGVLLKWIDHSQNESGYKIERSADGGSTFEEIAVVNVDNYTDNTAAAAMKYHYRIRGLAGSERSGFSNFASVDAGAPMPSATNTPVPSATDAPSTATPMATPVSNPSIKPTPAASLSPNPVPTTEKPPSGSSSGGGAMSLLLMVFVWFGLFQRRLHTRLSGDKRSRYARI